MEQDTLFEFLSRVWGGYCVFRPAYTARSVPGCSLGNRANPLWQYSRVLVLFSFVSYRYPPRSEPGAIWVCSTIAQDCVIFLCCLFVGDVISLRAPSLRL